MTTKGDRGITFPGVSMEKFNELVNCYNPESAGSQAPGPDVRACRRRSDMPVSGGQYVLTVVSRHLIACEHLIVRKE